MTRSPDGSVTYAGALVALSAKSPTIGAEAGAAAAWWTGSVTSAATTIASTATMKSAMRIRYGCAPSYKNRAERKNMGPPGFEPGTFAV